jgi:CRISPR-associated protein Cas5h
MRAFSVDFVGEMALFKKNDANDLVFTSYNFLHKPAVLGLFGAILGLSGYAKSGQGKHPEYYEKLKDLEIAIQPLFKKPLQKVITGFNNATGHANKGEKKDGATWQIREQVLVGEPTIGFRVYVKESDETAELKQKLQNYETSYPLYFGKNEFFAHFENYQEFPIKMTQIETSKINSLFMKKDNKLILQSTGFRFGNEDRKFIIFEQLPYDFDRHGFYMKELFVWSNHKIEITQSGFSKLSAPSGDEFYVQFV